MKTFKYLLFVILIMIVVSCDTDKKEEQIYPVTIETTNFSLGGWSCWQNLGFNAVRLINSERELNHYFTCKTDANIDFANYSLLVFNVEHCNIDSEVEKLLLQQISANKYLLSVDVIPSLTANVPPLIVSILVPKISETASVEMIINGNNRSTNPLIGTWREISPCEDCSLLTFSDNDTIYHQFTYDNSIVKLTYRFLSEDSIQIVRLGEPNPDRRMTNNKIVFYNSDSILIEKFTPTDAAVYPPQFIDIKLLKTR
ncbi:MAG: hypothetical protein LBV02_00345 [Bacteroidales bacterium]|jgi:hypothetical protein|nr:hypothetical protein [Bacteroidales bacterium]